MRNVSIPVQPVCIEPEKRDPIDRRIADRPHVSRDQMLTNVWQRPLKTCDRFNQRFQQQQQQQQPPLKQPKLLRRCCCCWVTWLLTLTTLITSTLAAVRSIWTGCWCCRHVNQELLESIFHDVKRATVCNTSRSTIVKAEGWWGRRKLMPDLLANLSMLPYWLIESHKLYSTVTCRKYRP